MSVDPSTLHLQIYPAKVLRAKAKAVPEVTQEIRDIAKAMTKIMYEEDGIGLAAPQVGLSIRLFVVDVRPDEKRSAAAEPVSATQGPVVYINPVISSPVGPVEPMEEGCLSLPDIRGDVLRPPTVTIRALGLDGREFTQTGTGLLARCWQHELDHLDGVLIIDKMTQMSRLRNKTAIRDLERA
ncbi:MAG: Peptide deformylase [Planctomycetota bacterium]|jgi:peptide deformylase